MGIDWKRAGLAVATGGLSEVVNPANDPTRVKKADERPIQGVTAEMGRLSKKYENKQIERYTPSQVAAQQVRPASIGGIQGSWNFQNAVQQAKANLTQAGQMDPRTLAFLQASQQGGPNTAQSLDLLRAAAMGQGPSAAQAQMQLGTDQAIKAQMAMAGSRGFNAAATRGAQMQGAEMQQQAVNQAAMLRAQEMQAAQQAFAQGALTQEGMARDAASRAAQINLQQDVARQQSIQEAINSYTQGAGSFAAMNADVAKAQAALVQQARMADQDAFLKAQMFNAQTGMQAHEMQQQQQLAYDQLANQMLAGQLGGLGTLFATEADRQKAIANARTTVLGGGISAGGGVLAAMMAPAAAASDARGKTDIKANKETQAFLNALTDNEYRYKDTSKPGTAPGTHYGPMAQDLAKTKMGRTIVIDSPDGMMVDTSRGLLLALSGLANINKRLAKMEGK